MSEEQASKAAEIRDRYYGSRVITGRNNGQTLLAQAIDDIEHLLSELDTLQGELESAQQEMTRLQAIETALHEFMQPKATATSQDVFDWLKSTTNFENIRSE